MTKKRALLVVGLALLLAAAGVVYAHWQDSLRMEVDVATGSIDPQWSLSGTNDDGVNDGWDGEPVGSTVYTYLPATSNDPSAPAGSGGAAGNVITVNSAVLQYSSTGWGGWSCPGDHPYIVSGAWTPAEFVMGETYLWKLGASTAGGVNYPATPFGYTYNSPNEQGFIARAGGTGGAVTLVLQCSDTAPAAPTDRYDKDVADCFASLHSDANGNTNDLLAVNITNAYPSYWCTVKADLHNVGTVPVKLQGISITNGLGDVIEYQIQDAEKALECGYQLDPGEPVDFYASFHPLNAAAMNTDYSFDMDFTWVNYNEYDPANCPSAPAPVQRFVSQYGPLFYGDGGGAGYTAVGGICPGGTTLIGGGLLQSDKVTVSTCPWTTVFMVENTAYAWHTTGAGETGIGVLDVADGGTCPNSNVWIYYECQ